MKKKLRKVLLSILAFGMTVCSMTVPIHVQAAEERTVTELEFYTYEDAFARNGRATTNYNKDEIGGAHDPAYEGKGYFALNTQLQANDECIAAMKFKLPTKEQVKENNLTHFEFVFDILLNKYPDAGNQTYLFHYAENTNWDETTLNWDNKPSFMVHDDTNVLFQFDTPKGDVYNGSTGDKNHISKDITETILKLVEKGTTEITVYVTAENQVGTFLLFHSRETSDSSKVAHISASSLVQNEYQVTEDAYIRNGGNSGINYDFENITQAHGAHYVGKNYRVVNVKNFNGAEIMSVMKFSLPTLAEMQANQYDEFELVFNIFKNADKKAQTYRFAYTSDVSWNETNITWNNRPKTIDRNTSNVLFDYVTEDGADYEAMNDQQREIHMDITNAVEQWVKEGKTEITIFAYAVNDLQTSLMIHERSSSLPSKGSNSTKAMKIVAKNTGINLDALKTLIVECEAFDEDDYTTESYQALNVELQAAKALVQTNPTDRALIRDAYQSLAKAKKALVKNIDPNDADNIAYLRPTRSNLNTQNTYKANDGDINTSWNGKFFPSYVDVDLMDTYNISEIILHFPKDKAIYYTLYGSNDGQNYDEIYKKHSDQKKTAADVIPLSNCQYRIIRVYLEYTDPDNSAYLSEIKVHGTKTNTNTAELRKGTFEEITGLKDFADTDYAKPISEAEIFENVYGIIDRTVGPQYRNWFTFEIKENSLNDNDYFELSNTADGKILIKGNEGLSLSTGLNYYYKNYVNVQISEQTMQNAMPDHIVPIQGIVRKETDMKVRYAFNYCTLSYTFAFFGEDDWQRENDWLALNGVNVVLDLAGQEATWIKYLMECGYSYDDAKDWLVGPGYYAWQFMDNMEVFGGPIPDGYVIDRVELARKTQRWKNSLGMQTVLQGYAGMVPTNFKDYYQGNITILPQGSWNGFARPDMIATDSQAYDELSRVFYDAQRFVYGDSSDYYAVDPFHEGGKRPSGLSDATIAKEVLNSMLEYDNNAVWIVQGWQDNPTSGLIEGMADRKEDHVLIVDLIKYPLQSTANYKESIPQQEFNNTNWAWCLVGNFGGNPTMNGQLVEMVKDIQTARKERKHMVGMGIISEATYDNPMIYDLIFDLVWADASFDLDQWMDHYLERRYGSVTDNAKRAWDLIKESNYAQGVRLTPELFGIRTGGKPADIGKKSIGYESQKLENALRLLMEDYDKFKDSEAYLYDLTEIMRQAVSNYTVLKYHEVIDARNAKELEAFRKAKAEFLNAFDVLNEVSSTQQDQLGGEWIGKALDLAQGYDDFSKSTFAMNAKSLITTWGSTAGALVDYGFRTYEGMFLDVRKDNWVQYLNQVEANLETGASISNPNYSRKYWKWVIGDQTYTRDAKDSPDEIYPIAQRVLTECVFTGELDANIGNLALKRFVETIGDKKGSADLVTDGTSDSVFTLKSTDNKPVVIIDLLGVFELSKIQVLLDETAQYGYEIYISDDKTQWHKAAEKNMTDTDNTFDKFDKTARYVKIVGTSDSKDDNSIELALKEIRVYGDKALPTLEHLGALVETAKDLNTAGNDQDKMDRFKAALAAADKAYGESAAVDTVNSVHWELYEAIINLDLSGLSNIALNKPTSSHNDPDGKSKQLVDGDNGKSWNSGRLSEPGKPYVHDPIFEGWNIIDLQGLYEVSNIQVSFGRSDIWYQYEIYVSLDGQNWEKVGEKKTETPPNEKEDTYVLQDRYARYIKLQTTNIKTDPSYNKPDGGRYAYDVRELVALGKEATIDKTSLQQLVDDVSNKNESNYTPKSWTVFADALENANQVLQADEMTLSPKIIADAKETLNDAMNALVMKTADYRRVDEALAHVKNVDRNKYTAGSLAKLDSAVNAVVRDLDITKQDEVNAMASAIETALNGLIEQVSLDALKDAIKRAETIHTIYYTPVTVKKLQDAILVAKQVMQNQNATQNEVNAAKQALEEAMEGLQLKDNETVDPSDPLPPGYVDHIVNDDRNVTVIGSFPVDVQLIVEYLNESVKAEIIANISNQEIVKKYTFEKVFDIYMLRKGTVYLPNGSFMIRIKLDDDLLAKRYLGIVYISDDGVATVVPSKVENGYISFTTDHNSYYAIVSSDSPITDTASKPVAASNAGAWLLLGTALFLVTKKKEKEIKKLYQMN